MLSLSKGTDHAKKMSLSADMDLFGTGVNENDFGRPIHFICSPPID